MTTIGRNQEQDHLTDNGQDQQTLRKMSSYKYEYDTDNEEETQQAQSTTRNEGPTTTNKARKI